MTGGAERVGAGAGVVRTVAGGGAARAGAGCGLAGCGVAGCGVAGRVVAGGVGDAGATAVEAGGGAAGVVEGGAAFRLRVRARPASAAADGCEPPGVWEPAADVWLAVAWAMAAPASRTGARPARATVRRRKTIMFMGGGSPRKRGDSKAAQAAGTSTQKVAPSPSAEMTPISPP